MPSVPDEAKSWIVVTSSVIVREDRADLVGVVVAEREALEMVVDPHAQVVRDLLADALGVVVVDVARDRAERRDAGPACPATAASSSLSPSSGMMRSACEPLRRLVRADDVVEDDLQRPRRGEAHRRLDEHGDEDDHERAAVGPAAARGRAASWRRRWARRSPRRSRRRRAAQLRPCSRWERRCTRLGGPMHLSRPVSRSHVTPRASPPPRRDCSPSPVRRARAPRGRSGRGRNAPSRPGGKRGRRPRSVGAIARGSGGGGGRPRRRLGRQPERAEQAPAACGQVESVALQRAIFPTTFSVVRPSR